MADLFPFQQECLTEISQFHGQCLNACDMGLGKTAMTLAWLQAETAWPAVVVCPATVKLHWKMQARIWASKQAFIAEGRRPKQVPPPGPEWLLIINWDILHDWAEAIIRWRPKAVVLDEIHFAANRRRKRTIAAKAIASGCRYRIGLSGTPLLNRPVDLWKPLNILRPELFPSFTRYGFRYCAPKRTPWGMDFRGASHTDELHEILTRNVLIRRRKEDVLQDLPSKIRTVIRLPLEDRREYTLAKNGFLKWLAGKDQQAAQRAANAVALTKLTYLKQLAARLKLQGAIQWVRDFFETQPDGKLVVFGIHHEIMSKLYSAIDVEKVVVHGGTPPAKRQEAVQRFQGTAQLFLGQLVAAGTGLDGLQCAQACTFVELGWRPGEIVQAEDRLHRIGQRDSVLIYYLVAENTIEDHLCKVLQEKQQVLSSIIDGGTQVGDLDIFNVLLRNLQSREVVR